MQIRELLTEQPAAQPAASTGVTAEPVGSQAAAGVPGSKTSQPVTPMDLSRALAPMGVIIKPTVTPTLKQYFTKIGGKTDQVKKTGDVYADTILTMFGYNLK